MIHAQLYLFPAQSFCAFFPRKFQHFFAELASFSANSIFLHETDRCAQNAEYAHNDLFIPLETLEQIYQLNIKQRLIKQNKVLIKVINNPFITTWQKSYVVHIKNIYKEKNYSSKHDCKPSYRVLFKISFILCGLP